jgi:hypothetical protein
MRFFPSQNEFCFCWRSAHVSPYIFPFLIGICSPNLAPDILPLGLFADHPTTWSHCPSSPPPIALCSMAWPGPMGAADLRRDRGHRGRWRRVAGDRPGPDRPLPRQIHPPLPPGRPAGQRMLPLDVILVGTQVMAKKH